MPHMTPTPASVTDGLTVYEYESWAFGHEHEHDDADWLRFAWSYDGAEGEHVEVASRAEAAYVVAFVERSLDAAPGFEIAMTVVGLLGFSEEIRSASLAGLMRWVLEEEAVEVGTTDEPVNSLERAVFLARQDLYEEDE